MLTIYYDVLFKGLQEENPVDPVESRNSKNTNEEESHFLWKTAFKTFASYLEGNHSGDGYTDSSNNTTNNLNLTQKMLNCTPNYGSSEVQLVNDTELISLLIRNSNVTGRDVEGIIIF